MRWSCAIVLVLVASACGGRVSHPIQLIQPIDDQLTCDHLQAEYSNNQYRVRELLGERADQMRDNVGFIATSILFIDLKDTERKEITAAQARNQRLSSLAKAKTCDPNLPVMTVPEPKPAPQPATKDSKSGK